MSLYDDEIEDISFDVYDHQEAYVTFPESHPIREFIRNSIAARKEIMKRLYKLEKDLESLMIIYDLSIDQETKDDE